MAILYALEPDLPATEFRAVLVASTLGERRPVDDLARLDRMLREADLVVTARDGKHLVGIARALTDFSYSCYLSDLAVDAAYHDLPEDHWVTWPTVLRSQSPGAIRDAARATFDLAHSVTVIAGPDDDRRSP